MNRVILMLKALKGFLNVVRDPRRTDEVFALARGLFEPEFVRPIAEEVGVTAAGATALAARKRLGAVDVAALARLPEGTVGRLYAEHMTRNGLSPDFFPERPGDDALVYVQMHFYETHDIWHVVTGFGTDVAGEMGLLAFYAAQVTMAPVPPSLIAAGLLNGALFARNDMGARLAAVVKGWQMGKAARPLFGIDWPTRWETPVAALRKEYAVGA